MHRREFVSVAGAGAATLAMNPSGIANAVQQKNPVVYPDPAVETVDPRFAKYAVGNAAVERLYTGARWAEGPVWFGRSEERRVGKSVDLGGRRIIANKR